MAKRNLDYRYRWSE